MNATERELWLALADNFSELRIAIDNSGNDIGKIKREKVPEGF
ncbi:MAG TPA: hypothetical protein PLF22_00010 [Pseudomonadales bacterium]|nr:hypothetical protein [Pseudomonadales bacterium]